MYVRCSMKKFFDSRMNALKSIRSYNDLKLFFQKIIHQIARGKSHLYNYYEVPPILQIEPTNYCNCNCICCSTSRTSREKGYMDFNLFQKIIDDAVKIGVKGIHLFLHGEPLLHLKFVDMVKYIKYKNLDITVHTNGMLLNKEKIKAILRSGVNRNDQFRFSILGYSKENHERIMRGINHEKVLKNIFDFLELREKSKTDGPIIEVEFYLMPENKQEEKQFVKYWQKKVDGVRVNNISKSFLEYKNREKTTPFRKITCFDLWERMTIYWNGDVTMCDSDIDGDYIIGNLEGESIKEIWNSKKLLSIKKLHEEKQFQKIPLCSKCDF